MVPESLKEAIVCVVGLGYVGQPLAEAFSCHLTTYGYDIDTAKIKDLQSSDSSIKVSENPACINHADFIIICVPTPVTRAKDPDLIPVR
ncbi:UDP-glucose/GDP-mannose dehydrogenase family, NAD binding domain [anaerobic digester metagenome]